jgi:hypothetical protein
VAVGRLCSCWRVLVVACSMQNTTGTHMSHRIVVHAEACIEKRTCSRRACAGMHSTDLGAHATARVLALAGRHAAVSTAHTH